MESDFDEVDFVMRGPSSGPHTTKSRGRYHTNSEKGHSGPPQKRFSTKELFNVALLERSTTGQVPS